MKTRKQEVAEAYKAMYAVYQKEGPSAVYRLFNEKYSHLGGYEDCEPCEEATPHIDKTCQVCGTGK